MRDAGACTRSGLTVRRSVSPFRKAELNRLYQMIEAGADGTEPVLVGRITELRALRDRAHADADRAAALMEKADAVVTPEMLRAFALAARVKLRNEGGTYRRDHLRALAQRIEVANGTDVRITGSKTERLRTLIAVAGVGSAEFRVHDLCRNGAPGKTRTSNPQIRSLVLYPIELRVPPWARH